jgi:hypothetical protein
MKRDTKEALLKDILPTDIDFDRAFAEICAIHPRDADVGAFRQMHGAAFSAKRCDLTIDDTQFACAQSSSEIDLLHRQRRRLRKRETHQRKRPERSGTHGNYSAPIAAA